MDLSREFPEEISLNWEDEEWIQPIDYEQLPFRSQHCHEYNHLGRNCPNDSPYPDLASPMPPRSRTDGAVREEVKPRRDWN